MKDDFFSFREKVIRPAQTAASVPSAIFTVTELTGQIDRAIRVGFPENVAVRGEVSNVRLQRESGHLYFTLKDSASCIDCVMFASSARNLRFQLEVGMEIQAVGRVGIYGSRGKYQITVTRLDALGRGALEIAFKQLFVKLQSEGLFDPARKRPIPKYPQRIILVTSTATAALQDMLKVLRRHGVIQLQIFHVPVQGGGAGAKIAAALQLVGSTAAADLILLARGGGSMEDLAEFNDERVARAMVMSRIPIITGIGHETDRSIADFVADHWAHTPTEAAAVAVGHWRQAGQTLAAAEARSIRLFHHRLEQGGAALAAISRHEFFRRPLDRIQDLAQQLDDLQKSLTLASHRRLGAANDRMDRSAAALVRHDPRNRIAAHRNGLVEQRRRLTQSLDRQLQKSVVAINAIEAHLNAVSPRSVLRRGYSITTRKKDGQLIRAAAELKPGDRIVTQFAVGAAESVVDDRKQMNLFE